MTTDDAIGWAGTQVALARLLGISQPSVAGWGDYPPPLRQIQIERLSKGRLKAEPDAYMPAKGAPIKTAKAA